MSRIDSFIQRYIDRGTLNGAVGLVAREGRIIYYQALGHSDSALKVPMKKDQIFRIASMTKPIISVAVMMLWEEGRFSLDDPVSRFIPSFASPRVIENFRNSDTGYTTVPARREITIRHLLTHTSGIGYAQIGTAEAKALYLKHHINGGIGTPYSTLREEINRLATLPLFNHPGEKYLYGLNTDVLGYLVEVVSGQPLDRFLRERLFLPLGMQDTWFFLPREKRSRLTGLFMQDASGKLLYQRRVVSLYGDLYRDFPNTDGSFFSGGAGLSSTALDYAIFCQMLLNGGIYGKVRILSPHAIRMMTTNQIGNLDMDGKPKEVIRFGLGFGVYLPGAEAISPIHAGTYDWSGLYATHFWIDPTSKLIAVFMRNVWPTAHWDFGDRVRQVVYQALPD